MDTKSLIADKKRSGAIDLMKFLASVLVVAAHMIETGWGNFSYGNTLALVVELFFLISGFFLMKHLDHLPADSTENTWSYVIHKIKGFFAPLCIANLVHFLLFLRLNQVNTVSGVAGQLWHFKWDFLLLQCAGMIQNPQFNVDYLIGPTWYLSAMMITLALLYPLARHYRKAFVNIICPLSVLVIYAAFIKEYGTINVGSDSLFLVPDALPRAFAGQCFGVLCYCGYVSLKDSEFLESTAYKVLDTVAWLMLPLMLILAFHNVHDSPIFFLIPMGLVVISCLLSATPVSGLLARIPLPVTGFLGKMSLYLYLTHYTVIHFVFQYLPLSDRTGKLLLSVLLTVVASLALFLLDQKRKSAKPVCILCALLLVCSFVQVLF